MSKRIAHMIAVLHSPPIWMGYSPQHMGQAEQADGLQPVGAAVVDASHERIIHLVGGEVNHPDELAFCREFFHRGPAHAVGMENDGLVSVFRQMFFGCHDGLRGIAQHRHRHVSLRGVGLRQAVAVLDHPLERRRHIVEDRTRNRIEPEDIDHRMDHHHVARADEGLEEVIAGGDRGDQDFGDADRQDHHGSRPHDGSFGAPHADDAVEPAVGIEAHGEVLERLAHAVDRPPSTAGVL